MADAVAARVLPRRYVDSVVLMRLAERLTAMSGIADAAAVMGTPANKVLLREGGFDGSSSVGEAQPDDLVVAVKAATDRAALEALDQVETLLRAGAAATRAPSAPTLDAALAAQQTSNLAVVSLPGEYAAAEARRALERGLHVFVFSSNVGLADEISLKALAAERGLLCMGPDCGTAIIGGVGLGFANAVRRGPVGIVGASGTGIQAIASMLDRAGVGVSHAIGTGSRDVTDAVGGATTIAGLRALDDDPATSGVVIVTKPPQPATAERIRNAAASCGKPVVVCFLGELGGSPATLEDAATMVGAAVGARVLRIDDPTDPGTVDRISRDRLAEQRFVRGLFAGGSLAVEAQVVLESAGMEVHSNVPLLPERRLADASRSVGHTVVDLGTEGFTRGRPHPMIDARLRRSRLESEADDPETAVVLLDIVLGYGAASDPAGDLADAIVRARAKVAGRGGELAVVASVCGTEGDPQGLAAQERALRASGALVAPTSAAAARLAARLVHEVGVP